MLTHLESRNKRPLCRPKFPAEAVLGLYKVIQSTLQSELPETATLSPLHAVRRC